MPGAKIWIKWMRKKGIASRSGNLYKNMSRVVAWESVGLGAMEEEGARKVVRG